MTKRCRIWLGNRDINRKLVAEGYAWAYRDYLTDMSLLEDEKSAREESGNAGFGQYRLNADAQIRQESEVHCYRGDQPHVSARGSEEAWI